MENLDQNEILEEDTVVYEYKSGPYQGVELDKRFLDNKKVQLMSKEKYYYTIKTRKEFFKYNKNNNLIFENL